MKYEIVTNAFYQETISDIHNKAGRARLVGILDKEGNLLRIAIVDRSN